MSPLPENERPVVLVVDDALSSLGMLCDTLEASGYTVLVAGDGAAALARLDLVTPDAILLDALMPGLDGFETCRRIKARAEWSHIPVIFMTGLSETSHIVKGFEAGGVDYVVKPVRVPEVLARLATHLRNARAVRMARDAIDVGGLGVLLVDAHRRVAWRSPRAQRWLTDFFGNEPGTDVDTACIAWLDALTDPATDLRTRALADRTLTARRLGGVGLGLDETMWLVSDRPVMKITGMCDHSARALMRRQVSKPSRPGISASSRMASGVTRSSRASAAAPSPATSTV